MGNTDLSTSMPPSTTVAENHSLVQEPTVMYVHSQHTATGASSDPCYRQSHIHGYHPKRAPAFQEDNITRPRRMSHDEKSVTGPRRFLIDVEETIRVVLEQEDTDGDFQISITDAGPKLMALGTATSNGFKTFDIRVCRARRYHVPC